MEKLSDVGEIRANTLESASLSERRGPKPKPIVKYPEPIDGAWEDPAAFHEALQLQMTRHGDTAAHLQRALYRFGDRIARKTIVQWAQGEKTPREVSSIQFLERLEQRYRLPERYFRDKLGSRARAASGHRKLPAISTIKRRRLAWHLPEDFDQRSEAEREEIIRWVEAAMLSGSTDYRRFQSECMKHRYALRFPDLARPSRRAARSKAGPAPKDRLASELAEMVKFKTAVLTDVGFERHGVWNSETAAQRVEHLSLMFGAMSALRDGPVAGLGVQREDLALGLLAFPAIWEWYSRWREQRRGFFTMWEVDMLVLGASLTRSGTGWIQQNPRLAEDLVPIPGLVSADDIRAARSNWSKACHDANRYAVARSKEIKRVARVHRDPFEPIIVVLEADNPVGEYRLITEEILARLPDQRREPVAAAEAVRGFLMLRLGLHLGFRQKNLRQLLLCRRGQRPSSERSLELAKRGELRWNERENGWEVLVPASAFKNGDSTFFGKRAFRLMLPNLAGLYEQLEAYIDKHRATLLKRHADPSTLFVKTMKRTSRTAEYDITSFYEAWRLIIQRYGIYNPWTKQGAIQGLLPHGPHSVRDVLATHVLKKTGSYEQASYAIQDTPDTVAKHYGRFLPHDKAALAAKVLDLAWT